nr:hypothetical protein [Rhizobium sp. BK196]
MLCAFLRNKGIPARVRCGFASYFSAEWEHHWLCECAARRPDSGANGFQAFACS